MSDIECQPKRRCELLGLRSVLVYPRRYLLSVEAMTLPAGGSDISYVNRDLSERAGACSMMYHSKYQRG